MLLLSVLTHIINNQILGQAKKIQNEAYHHELSGYGLKAFIFMLLWLIKFIFKGFKS